MAVMLPPSRISSFSVGLRPVGIYSNTKFRAGKKVETPQFNTSGKEIAKIRVLSSVKDLEESVKGSRLGDNMGLREQFSAQPSATKMSKEEEQRRDFYLNTGYAIQTLREEFPILFLREITFDIYRDDIVFKDPINTFVGIENYKSIFWALRFHGRIFFKALWIDIVSVWQPVENMIMVRWTVHGIPRVPWESRGRFDGTSEYKLDKKGKIYEHRVHNIALNAPPPKFLVRSVQEMIQCIGCGSTPKPTFFEISSSSFKNFMAGVNSCGPRCHLSSILSSSVWNQEDIEESSERRWH
ncbi:unnamed protein product [Cuscuta campestris]|uniref:Uncharacterized protein n=2 Tax=Cuscuta sect. Cleistogrammica TaxID=1824901 RepID=A0A484NBI9_9ASTE|nr:hypothetical protein DM860_016706 [Cuscuta australis]VFQ98269.1 unnamed protein product [Cuscuta campestris]